MERILVHVFARKPHPTLVSLPRVQNSHTSLEAKLVSYLSFCLTLFPESSTYEVLVVCQAYVFYEAPKLCLGNGVAARAFVSAARFFLTS